MDEQRPRTVSAQAFWRICEYWGIEVRAIYPIAPSHGDAEAKERRFSTAAGRLTRTALVSDLTLQRFNDLM